MRVDGQRELRADYGASRSLGQLLDDSPLADVDMQLESTCCNFTSWRRQSWKLSYREIRHNNRILRSDGSRVLRCDVILCVLTSWIARITTRTGMHKLVLGHAGSTVLDSVA
jgi:hypothetical protein